MIDPLSRICDLNSESAVIVRTIAALGQALCIETTAEGIESTTQLNLVRQAGCTEGQGYLRIVGPVRPRTYTTSWRSCSASEQRPEKLFKPGHVVWHE